MEKEKLEGCPGPVCQARQQHVEPSLVHRHYKDREEGVQRTVRPLQFCGAVLWSWECCAVETWQRSNGSLGYGEVW